MTTLRARLASLPQRALTFTWDNPSAEQDARGILSAPKLGTWFGLEVLLLCLGSLGAFALLPAEDTTFHQAMVKAGTGQYLISACLITLTAFVTLVVPVRSAGLLEGPRLRGYMDQVVTTGIAPLRYFAGKWATSQAFFLALIVASLPMTVLFGLLGGATLGRTLVAYVLIYAYCNLLLVLTLAMGAMFHEAVAVFTVWFLFGAFTFVEYLPLPSTAAAFTPHRFLIQPFVESLAGANAGIAMRIYGDAHLLGVTIPWTIYALGLWLLLGGLATITLALGPLHRFLPGTNNFGAVVLPGDGKRLFFRRIRPMLTRRVELAFLFENRGPRLMRWGLPLRAIQQLGTFAVVSLLILGLVMHPITITAMRNFTGLMVFHGMAMAGLLVLLTYIVASAKSDATQGFSLTRRIRIPLAAFDTAVFFMGCALLVVLHLGVMAAAWPDLSMTGGMTRWSSIHSPTEFLTRCSLNLAVFTPAAVILFLLVKSIGCRTLNRDAAHMSAVLVLAALVFLPGFFLAAAEAARRADDTSLHWLTSPFLVFGQASPGMALFLAEEGWQTREWGTQTHWLLGNAYWFWSSALIMILGVSTTAASVRGWREGQVLEGVRPGSKARACPGCQGNLPVPMSSAWWGGGLLPGLLGFVRCLDCETTYHRKHTDPPLLWMAGAFLLRLGVSLGALVGLWLWVVWQVT